MGNLKIYFGGFEIKNEITYHKEGNYLIPDLVIANYDKDYHIKKYGHLRLNYLKEHKKVLYIELILDGTLQEHLTDIDKKVNDNDILKECLDFREETYLCYMSNKDKKIILNLMNLGKIF